MFKTCFAPLNTTNAYEFAYLFRYFRAYFSTFHRTALIANSTRDGIVMPVRKFSTLHSAQLPVRNTLSIKYMVAFGHNMTMHRHEWTYQYLQCLHTNRFTNNRYLIRYPLRSQWARSRGAIITRKWRVFFYFRLCLEFSSHLRQASSCLLNYVIQCNRFFSNRSKNCWKMVKKSFLFFSTLKIYYTPLRTSFSDKQTETLNRTHAFIRINTRRIFASTRKIVFPFA